MSRINLDEYKKLPEGIIRSGLISNTPSGYFATRNENLPLLKFVVVKYSYGWSAYVLGPNTGDRLISETGDKVNDNKALSQIFPCDEEVSLLYNR